MITNHHVIQWLSQSPARKWGLLVLPALAAVSFFAISQSTPAANPLISLASEPLYAKGTRDKPTLTLALSVEFPTVGAQYTKAGSSELDDTYVPTTEYIGYFDSTSCYTYNNAPTEVASTATNYSDFKRFVRSGAATSRTCGGIAFSGNFMNWATSSAVDMLRMGLTGGDRIVDTSTLTVLQRAVIRQDMFINSYFPSKQLLAAHVSGALPDTLKGTHTGAIYVANCLNKVFFGTGNTTKGTNACGAFGANGVPGTSGDLGVTEGTAGTTALATTQNYFFARVQVCDSDNAGGTTDPRKFNDESYCVKYPSGVFKPVGNLQRYSESMRVAVFGYLKQDGTERYGGVLRSPMKYVGQRYYDSSGVLYTTDNPNAEWNTSTGVFVDNPDGHADGISGAINYINKFGRTAATPGAYKSNDPVGELYYEALRYLQGLGPTSGTTIATSPTHNMTDAQKDGFPVYSTWTDPHAGGASTNDYTCLKNNLFTIGDIGTHADKYIPGNTRTGNDDVARTALGVAYNEPNFVEWTKVVGKFEAGESYAYKPGLDSTTATVNTSNPNSSKYTTLNNLETLNTGAGSAAYYLAGMAYWAKNHDIRGTDWTDQPTKQRPGMRVTSYMLDVNQNASSANANTRRKSQFFLAAKYGGFNDLSGQGNPFYKTARVSGSFPTGSADNSVWDKSNINYFNPTQPGEARTHFLVSDGRGVLTTLSDIFSAIAREGNSIAGGAISTQRLTSVGGFIYQAQFDAAEWTGDLVSQYVRVSSPPSGPAAVTVSSGTLSDPHQWSAADRLQAKIVATPDASTRNIVVGKTTPTTSATATNFKWSEIDTDLQTAMGKATLTATADARGEDRVNYIRGVRTLEGTTVSGTAFRKRGGLLGDIINSGVAYSGVPSGTVSSTSAYTTFYNDNANRTKALFVGANDGMLHAFNATNGDEIFGYIPSWVGPNLPALTATNYNAGNHKSYLDGSPAVGEAQVGSDWKTVLVSGTGAGGQGVFALDITTPESFGPSKVLWEFTDRNDVDMGNVIGRPQILKFRTSAPNASTAVYKWFAVVPSGVNNNASDGYFSTTGKPALFLLDLSKAPSANWQANVNYYKISLPAGSTSKPAGLANFAAIEGRAGEVNYIYMGDMQGNLWKLNFVDAGSSNWNLDTLSPFKSTASPYPAIPFFIAKDTSGAVQPISGAPALSRGPDGGVLVIFGTGKYLETADNVVTSSTQVQSMYVLLDNGSSSAEASSPTSTITGRSSLQAGSVNTTTGAITTASFLWGRFNSTTGTRSGWYIDFPNQGERQVSSFGILGTQLVFGSVVPPNTITDPCGSGSGYQYFANLATGIGVRSLSVVGLLGEPFVLEMGNAAVSERNSIGSATKTTTGKIILQGSEGLKVVEGDGSGRTDGSGDFSVLTTVGRLSWRQISNYYELKNQ
jgi:type IV pilus assembly protein PilY1